ncbi:MAG: Gfo/Idh/MocA family oxidoreductase [Candidatus Sumerlaeota bacterium]|nr:Gfo/Idh/MocA family oxidoreductase [Candidatus Sumerlaeota bacterium]
MKTLNSILAMAAFLTPAAMLVPADGAGADLRIGMIGLDTSHVSAFASALNNPKAKDHVPGGRVVAAFKGGSPDIAASRDRMDKFTQELQEKYGVKIVDSIEELCKQVDVVMIESVDGRPHLEQARPVIQAGKPLYIDKPMAGSLRDALEIFRLAREKKVPVFSCSSLRFGKTTQAVRGGSIGKVLSAATSSPVSIEPHHPELFWYGIHGIEALFAVMGPGCETVKRGTTPDGKIEVTGTWSGGRVGVFHQSSDNKSYGGVAKGEKGETPVGGYDGYAPMLVEVMKFFQTGVSPVPEQETIEILAFMEASGESKRLGGQPVRISDILKKAGAN